MFGNEETRSWFPVVAFDRGYQRDEVVELARLCTAPGARWATRVCLRLWREVAGKEINMSIEGLTKDQVIEAIEEGLPCPRLIGEWRLDERPGAVEFEWRGVQLVVGVDPLSVHEVREGLLYGTNVSLLMYTLIARRAAENIDVGAADEQGGGDQG